MGKIDGWPAKRHIRQYFPINKLHYMVVDKVHINYNI